jgi:hypothetical protein
MDGAGTLKTPAVIIALILAAAACESTTGPASQPNPAGTVAAWFNGNSGTIDLYFPGCDSLVGTAYVTGNVPNDLLYLGGDLLSVVCSFSATLEVFDLTRSGAAVHEIQFPQGSNPWAVAQGYDRAWVTLLMSGQIAVVSTDDWTLAGSVDVPDNPSGIAVAAGNVFVSHANYPVAASPGGVTVLNAVTLEQEGWIDTGINTTEIWYSTETGMLHAFSTTYADDGLISIIDPVSCSIVSVVNTGGAPHSPVDLGDSFACCGGFTSEIILYDEAGTVSGTWVPDSSVTLSGLAVSGDTLYMTDFGGNRVCRAIWSEQNIIPDLAAGNGPQGVTAVQR